MQLCLKKIVCVLLYLSCKNTTCTGSWTFPLDDPESCISQLPSSANAADSLEDLAGIPSKKFKLPLPHLDGKSTQLNHVTDPLRGLGEFQYVLLEIKLRAVPPLRRIPSRELKKKRIRAKKKRNVSALAEALGVGH